MASVADSVRQALASSAVHDAAVCLALSGGVDSVVLLDVLHALASERKLRLFAKDTYVSIDFKEKKGRLLFPSPRIRDEVKAGRMDLTRLSPLEIMVKRLVKEEKLAVKDGLEPLRAEDEEFLDSVRHGRPPLVTGEHGVLAMETADRLEAGNVWINSYFNLASGSPFGGFKESGIGSEYCHETLNMYTHLKAITVQNEPSAAWFLP